MDQPFQILVVDDEPANRLLLTKFLERAGYRVVTANDGFEAVDATEEHHPDLVLMDIMMPGRDGLETCTVLKSRESTAAIPVIFVTAVSEKERILEAFSVGGCDFVTKPVNLKELQARVSVHLRLQQVEGEIRERNEQVEALAGQLAQANIELASLSRLDALTNLLNRRVWAESADQEHVRFLRHGQIYSIVMIDVDHFKLFNDSQGHQAGDECLRRVATAIAECSRRGDVVGRYGGEEFVVLASNTSIEAAVKLAERIRKAIWALAIPHPSNSESRRVTISAGVAAGASGKWEDVLARADQALYVAKRAGRNMVFADGLDTPAAPPDPLLETPSAPAHSAAEEDARKATVLVVDDEPANRALCKHCLERAGYKVQQVEDGRAALASVGQNPPDVIIMDVMMPHMDGLECTRRLKADPDVCDIPIIIVSALAKSEDVLAGLEAGADEYLTKPIKPAELVLRVRSMARQYQSHRDLLQSYQVRGEHVRVLTGLVEFCRTIGTSRDMDGVLEHAIAAVADLTHSTRISIMLPSSERRHLTIKKSVGIEQGVADAVNVPVGEPVAGRVFATGKPVVVNSVADSPPNREAYDSDFFASVPMVSAPLGTSDCVVGVLNVTERIGRRPFAPHELEYIELIASVAGTACHDILTRESHDRACDSVMVALAKLAEHRDNDTGLHLDRVTQYCGILAAELRQTDQFRDQIDDAFIQDLAKAAPLHDIGKVAIPDHILLYPGKLAEEQMTIMRTHSSVGAQTIRTVLERTPGVGFLEMAADIAQYHHEWYDGFGYPFGLEADAIPLSARITALADVYDALTTKRVYKDAVSHDRAAAIVVEASGTQFDPAVIDAFLKRETEFASLAQRLADGVPEDAAGQLLQTGTS